MSRLALRSLADRGLGGQANGRDVGSLAPVVQPRDAPAGDLFSACVAHRVVGVSERADFVVDLQGVLAELHLAPPSMRARARRAATSAAEAAAARRGARPGDGAG